MQIGQNEPKICISVDFCMCCADCNRKYDFAHKYTQKTKNAHFSALFANLLCQAGAPTRALPGPYRGLPGPTGAYRGPTGALPGPYRALPGPHGKLGNIAQVYNSMKMQPKRII